MEMGLIDEVLKAVKAQGIQNILALRGGVSTSRFNVGQATCPWKDAPRGEEEWIASDPRFTRAN